MRTLLLTTILLLIPFNPWMDFNEDVYGYNYYVQRHFVAPIHYTKKDLRCMTEAIYYEAGNQSSLGKEAVATVIMNRVRHKNYPATICGVVYQHTYKDDLKVCQFSFTCQEKYKPHYGLWKESKIIAQRVLKNYYHSDILKSLDKALWFHAVYVNPFWSQQKVLITQIGDHLFYRDKQKES